MTENEQNKLDMYEAVLTLLTENRESISGNNSISRAITKLRNVIDEIKKEDKQISSETFELTILTSKLKDDVVFGLVPLASALFNYAKATGDIQLKQKTRFTQSHFVRMMDKELLEKSEVLLILASRNFSKLKAYKITQEILHDIKENIALLKNSLENKVASFISTSALTPLRELFDEADRILSRSLDVHMEVFEESNEDLYDEYLWTRDVENLDEKKALMEIEEEE